MTHHVHITRTLSQVLPDIISAYSNCLKSTSYDLDAQSVIHGSVSSTSPSIWLAMQSLRPHLEVKNSDPSFKKDSQVICTHTEISAALLPELSKAPESNSCHRTSMQGFRLHGMKIYRGNPVLTPYV